MSAVRSKGYNGRKGSGLQFHRSATKIKRLPPLRSGKRHFAPQSFWSSKTPSWLKLAHRAYVLENGAITLEGKASDLLHNENVKKAYLGI